MSFDADFRPRHGDASQGGTITLSSKRRAVNNDHYYYAVPIVIPDEPEPSRDGRMLTVRRARKSVRRAIRTIVSKVLISGFMKMEKLAYKIAHLQVTPGQHTHTERERKRERERDKEVVRTCCTCSRLWKGIC